MPSTVSSAVLGNTDLETDPVLFGEVEGEVETGEAETPASEVAESEEGQPVESASETTEEIAEEEIPVDEETELEEPVEEEPAASPRTQARMRHLSSQAARAQRFAPILDMLERNPQMTREIVARELGLVPQGQPAAQPVQPQAQQPQQPIVTVEELQKNPVAALEKITTSVFERMMAQRVAPAERQLVNANVETLVENFKARAATADPDRWSEYEPYFDALIGQTDPRVIIQSPKQTLRMLKNMAFGEWYERQQGRIAQARRANPKPRPAQAGRRNALTTPSGAGGQNQRSLARATRALTDEERILADRYGLDLVTPDEGE